MQEHASSQGFAFAFGRPLSAVLVSTAMAVISTCPVPMNCIHVVTIAHGHGWGGGGGWL